MKRKEIKTIKENQPKLTNLEWVLLFPEAKKYLEEKRKRLITDSINLRAKIWKEIMSIPEGVDHFTKWFRKEKTKIFYGEELEKNNKEIRRINFLLNPPKNKKGQLKESEIRYAKNRDFKEVLEMEGIQVNRFGFALCPFHKEKNPSFYITVDNRGVCFGCSWNGDVIDFIKNYKKLNFVEAVKYLN